jgi:hypothetical protein
MDKGFFNVKKQKVKVQVKKCNLARGVKAKRRKTRTGIVYLAQVLPMTACELRSHTTDWNVCLCSNLAWQIYWML